MQLVAGTSGFSYDEWRGRFYPEDLPADAMLGYYAEKLAGVEINNTFYRMPKRAVLEQWGRATPESFRFALKASRRITHFSKLANVSDSVAYLVEVSSVLGEKLGALLFQLPPFLRRDDALLADFLALLPAGCPAAMEFRHPSWFDDRVFALLREKNVALCGGDREEGPAPPLVVTADFAYLRLRAPDYDDAALGAWAARITAEPWRRVFAFFKHETKGPELAARLVELVSGPGIAKAPAAPVGPGLRATRPAAKPRRKRSKDG